MKRNVSLLALVAVLALAAFVAVTNASPPSGVTPTILARGTFEPFKVKTSRKSPVDFEAKGKSALDVVVRRHDYAVASSTGWHTHPGPVFITVTLGQLTYYEADDPTCAPHIVTAGQGFVDTGGGHMVRNESGAPAQDVSVIIAPVGGAFRGELPAPNPACGF